MNSYRSMLFAGAVVVLAIGCGRANTGKESDAAEVDSVMTEPASEAGDAVEKKAVLLPGEVMEAGFIRPAYKSDADREALSEMRSDAANRFAAYLVDETFRKKVAGLKETEDQDGMPVYGKLAEADFRALSVGELTYYAGYHPEEWYQICAEYLYDVGELQGVFSYLPIETDDPSERQIAGLEGKKSEVSALLMDFMDKEKLAPLELLRLVALLKLREVIPQLIATYKAQLVKDDLILTTMIQLMNEGNYAPWVQFRDKKVDPSLEREWFPHDEVTADKIMYYAKKYSEI